MNFNLSVKNKKEREKERVLNIWAAAGIFIQI